MVNSTETDYLHILVFQRHGLDLDQSTANTPDAVRKIGQHVISTQNNELLNLLLSLFFEAVKEDMMLSRTSTDHADAQKPSETASASLVSLDTIFRRHLAPPQEFVVACFPTSSEAWLLLWSWTQRTLEYCFINPTDPFRRSIIIAIDIFYWRLACPDDIILGKHINTDQLLLTLYRLWSFDLECGHVTVTVPFLLSDGQISFEILRKFMKGSPADQAEILLRQLELAISQPFKEDMQDYCRIAGYRNMLNQMFYDEELVWGLNTCGAARRLTILARDTVQGLGISRPAVFQPMMDARWTLVAVLINCISQIVGEGAALMNQAFSSGLGDLLYLSMTEWTTGKTTEVSSDVRNLVNHAFRACFQRVQRQLYHRRAFRHIQKPVTSRLKTNLQGGIVHDSLVAPDDCLVKPEWDTFSENFRHASRLWNPYGFLPPKIPENWCENDKVSAALLLAITLGAY